jgi:hypothetical protein
MANNGRRVIIITAARHVSRIKTHGAKTADARGKSRLFWRMLERRITYCFENSAEKNLFYQWPWEMLFVSFNHDKQVIIFISFTADI